MSKKGRFAYDPLADELSAVESLDFIGTDTLEQSVYEDAETITVYSNEKKEKKIYSYYLEKDLIKRLKGLARFTELSYSGLVSNAIREYIEEYGF